MIKRKAKKKKRRSLICDKLGKLRANPTRKKNTEDGYERCIQNANRMEGSQTEK